MLRTYTNLTTTPTLIVQGVSDFQAGTSHSTSVFLYRNHAGTATTFLAVTFFDVRMPYSSLGRQFPKAST